VTVASVGPYANHLHLTARRTRQITTPPPHQSNFYRSDALPNAQPTVSKHWMAKSQCRLNMAQNCLQM